MINITDRFLESLYKLSKRELPANVVEQAKMSIIDYISCTNLGQSMLQEENNAYLSNILFEEGKTSIIGASRKTTVHNALVLNGINAHYVELDDGHRYGMIHLGSPIITSMIALAQNHELDANKFLKGIVIGYEVAIRLATAIQPGHKLKGYHATGTCGTIGAAVGMGIVLDYSLEQLKITLTAAATDAAGILQVIDDGSKLKAYNVGRAAVAAMNALYIAKTGLNGPGDVLGGERGFFKVMADAVKEQYLMEGFKNQYAIELIYRKPYAACRHCHAAIEAALNLKKENELNVVDVEKIHVVTYNLAVKGHDHTEIQGTTSAKMSIPYSVAAALLYGKAGYQEYEEEALNDEMLNNLVSRVCVSEEPELSKLVPAKRVAIVNVVTKDGVYEQRVDYPKGEPENPISREELESKYYSLMDASGKDRIYSKTLLENIWDLENNYKKILDEL